MVEVAVVREGITNRAVIQALLEVPRHEFVPTRLHKDAYVDKALPIGYQQTISPPYIVAYMTESLDPKPTDRILEIGTGSGYQAAVLGEICKEVHSIGDCPQLAAARQNDWRNPATITCTRKSATATRVGPNTRRSTESS